MIVHRENIFNEKLQAAARDEELEEQKVIYCYSTVLSARDSNRNTQAVQNYPPVISQN